MGKLLKKADSIKLKVDVVKECRQHNQQLVGILVYDVFVWGFKRWLNNHPELGIYRPYSSARVNESAAPLTKKLLWARIELTTFRSQAKHCTTEPSGPLVWGSFQMWYRQDKHV